MPARFLGPLTAAVVALWVGSAGAAGFGVYGGGAAGDVWDFWGQDVTTRHSEFGLVLDTTVARSSVFGYRLQVGYDHLTATADAGIWDLESDANLKGVVWDNTFGFRLFQAPSVRLWLGPQVRFARYWGHAEYDDGAGGKQRTKVRLSTFGVGPAVGVNWNLRGGPTVALTGGWRVTFYNGSERPEDSESWGGSDYEDFAEGLWFVQLSLLYRFGDDGSPLPANP
ncbi:MAG: hypothetical protein HZB55_11520 [Deltaproteobacteria bacterium]|nr:hypothetical protein [Deltaproteobacteria bacterium]